MLDSPDRPPNLTGPKVAPLSSLRVPTGMQTPSKLQTSDAANCLVRRFSRLTTSGQVVAEVDGLRFLAIAGVLLYHGWMVIAARNGVSAEAALPTAMNRFLGGAFSCGHYGVQLFFVISGYILSLPFAKAHHGGRSAPRLKNYFLRRLTRLEPPYLINLLLSTVIVAIAFDFGIRSKGSDLEGLLPHLLASAVYCHGFIFHDLSAVNGVTWSLEVEVQFYLLMPLLAWLLGIIADRRARSAVLVATILAHGILLTRAPTDAWWVQYSLAGYLNYFLAGMLWAELSSVPSSLPRPPSSLWDAGALAAVAIFSLPSAWVGTETCLPLVFALFCAAGIKGKALPSLLRIKPVWLIGGMCYTIYLYHLWIVLIGSQLMRSLYIRSLPFWANFLLQFPILAVVVLLASAALYLLVEKPCMDKTWPSKLLRRVSAFRAQAKD